MSESNSPVNKAAVTRYPVHPLIRERWSPRAFADRPVDRETLGSLLEAARWAASCNNEQPWIFIVARKEDGPGFERILRCLVPGNQAWAQSAPVLLVSLARTTFASNGQPNRHAWHDVGAATAQLTLQATALGLAVHPMAGIDRDCIRAEFALPDGVEPVAGIAVGWVGDPETLPERLRERETAPRERKSLDAMVLGGW
ncbi:MAG TPA: nitroreductase family protein [Thermoanaerobaculia bacterium]|jgi:nitroreductase|nr:nitroreductase family protein [Thermoanaerobaculia bacterium]